MTQTIRFLIVSLLLIKTGYSNTNFTNALSTKISQTSNKESLVKDVFLDISLSKNTAYVQEPVIVTISIFIKNGIGGQSSFKNSQLSDDFLVYDLHPNPIERKEVNIDGQKFSSRVISRKLIYPQKSGTFEINSIEVEFNRSQMISKNGKLINEKSATKETLKIKKKLLKVLPFPEKYPLDFSGISSPELKFKENLHPTTIKAFSTLIYDITLSGVGNLKAAHLPKLELPKELFQTNCQNIIVDNTANDKLPTTRTFRYSIVPLKEGNFIIPSVSLSYYNTTNNEFISIKTDSTPIIVQGSLDEIQEMNNNKQLITNGGNDRSIVFVIDISNSSKAMDFKPNRLEASANTIKEFISKQYGMFGLVAFSDYAKLICPLTKNHLKLLDSLNTFKNLKLGLGSAIGLGLGTAIAELNESESHPKSIVLISDGDNNGETISPLMAARLANKYKISICSICIASNDSLVSFPFKTKYGEEKLITYPNAHDEKLMKDISLETGGSFHKASDMTALKRVFDKLNSLLDSSNNVINRDYFSDFEAESILNTIKLETKKE